MPEHVYIGELARLIDRRIVTIRKWEHDGILPPELLPQRDENNRRHWTRFQAFSINKWVRERNGDPRHLRGPRDEVKILALRLAEAEKRIDELERKHEPHLAG